MSNISDIYDAVNSTLSTLWGSTHQELVNPYDVALNNTLTTNRGYGFYYGPAINTKRNLSCKLSVEREIIVVNTVINRGTYRDDTIRKTAEKLLLEDQFSLIQELEKDPTIHDIVSKLEFNSDNGIEFVFDEKFNYLFIETSFLMEYFENLTP